MIQDEDDPRVIVEISIRHYVHYDVELLDLDVPLDDGRPATEVTELIWDPDNPHAVTLAVYERFEYDAERDVEITFARELITHGTQTFTGVGDGEIRIALDRRNPAWMAFTAKPHAEPWITYAPRATVEQFAREIYERFPHVKDADIESQDWDSGLLALLNGTP